MIGLALLVAVVALLAVTCWRNPAFRRELRCRIGLHPWGQWSEPMEGKATVVQPLTGRTWERVSVVVQERACSACRQHQLREVR